MAIRALPNNELGLGRAVLLATDTIGMACEGAFWLFDTEDEKWRFFLATSFVELMGPQKIYLSLNETLRKIISPEEMEDFQFYIIRPKEKLVRDLRKLVKTDRLTTMPQEVNLIWKGEQTIAVVYRMAPALSEPKSAQRRFRRRSGQLALA